MLIRGVKVAHANSTVSGKRVSIYDLTLGECRTTTADYHTHYSVPAQLHVLHLNESKPHVRQPQNSPVIDGKYLLIKLPERPFNHGLYVFLSLFVLPAQTVPAAQGWHQSSASSQQQIYSTYLPVGDFSDYYETRIGV